MTHITLLSVANVLLGTKTNGYCVYSEPFLDDDNKEWVPGEWGLGGLQYTLNLTFRRACDWRHQRQQEFAAVESRSSAQIRSLPTCEACAMILELYLIKAGGM